MFDIGWSELAVVACVTILVVGPKELPGLLRTMGKTVGQLRKMAGDFQKQFDEAIREAELDEVKKTMKAPFQPLEDARKAALDFQGKVNKEVNSIGADASAKPALPPIPAGVLDPLPTPVMPKLDAAPVEAPAAVAEKKPAVKAAKKAATSPAAKPKPEVKPATQKSASAKTAKPGKKA